MSRFSILLLVWCCLWFAAPVLAQEEDEEEYDSEFVYGINFNTNGGIIGGVILKYAKSISPRMYQSFGLEIVNVKHPKELRSAYCQGCNSVIFGKQNYLFAIRPSYGRELILFRKAPDEGVQINAIAAAGPSIGLIKPYYIQYAYSSTDIRSEQYSPEIHSDSYRILGSSNIFDGFGESNLAIGAHLKTGLSFELSGFRNSVTGFEVGFLLEAYTKKIILIPAAENRNVFTSAYLNLYFGSKK